MLGCSVLWCTVMWCVLVEFRLLCCVVMNCDVMNCGVMNCGVVNCSVVPWSDCVAAKNCNFLSSLTHCTALQYTLLTVLYPIVLYCSEPNQTALYCISFFWAVLTTHLWPPKCRRLQSAWDSQVCTLLCRIYRWRGLAATFVLQGGHQENMDFLLRMPLP